jgi:hypothetical protein
MRRMNGLPEWSIGVALRQHLGKPESFASKVDYYLFLTDGWRPWVERARPR